MKILLCGLLVLALLLSGASAQERITGAFGLKLGAVFDVKGAQTMEGRENIYRITPSAPVKGLTEYSVVVTPKTRRIAGILASGETPDADAAGDLASMLGIILRDKYGGAATSENTRADDPTEPTGGQAPRPRVMQRGPGLLDEPVRIHQGQRTVEVAARAPERLRREFARKGSVYLSYWDHELMGEVQKETALIKQEEEAAKKAAQEAREKTIKEEWERKRAAENERRAKRLEALKEEASKLDASAL